MLIIIKLKKCKNGNAIQCQFQESEWGEADYSDGGGKTWVLGYKSCYHNSEKRVPSFLSRV